MLHRWRSLLRTVWPVIILVALAGCASSRANRAPAAAPDEPSGPPIALERPPVLVVEAIVTDKKGAPVTTLRVSDFQVSVDGRRRPGAAVARLYRGPGAAALASSITSTAPGETQPLAEPSRTIVVVLDQPSFGPGDETRARTIVEAWMAAVGVADQVAVVSLPLRAGATIAFERAAIRQTLTALKPLRATGAEALLNEAADPALAGQDTRPPDVQAAGQQQDAGGGENPEVEKPRREADGGQVSAAVLKAHAVSSLGGLSAVLRSLARWPGAKTILFVSAGLVATNASVDAAAVLGYAAGAQARIFTLQVPTPSGSYGDAGGRYLRDMAQETGGALVPLSSKPEAALERLAGQLSFSYLLMLTPMPGDTEPGPHALSVTLPRRSDLVVRTPRRVMSGRVTTEAIVASLSPRAIEAAAALPPPVGERPAAPPQPGPATGPPRPSFAHDPALNSFIARVADYVLVYGDELSSVVSEETYTQEATAPRRPTGRPSSSTATRPARR